MSLSKNPSPDQTQQIAGQLLAEDTHFLKAVTEVAERREVTASEDIYASSGMKLVGRGTKLSGTFYDRLVQHKLLKPIEQSVSISDAIDAASLVALVRAESCRVPLLAASLDQPESLEQLQGIVGSLKIPSALSLKLSVMQESRPPLFLHGLIAAMISTELGVRGKLPREDLQALVLASVFHDAGELYIDPAILAPEHRMTADERRHLYAHPITGFLMLRDFKEIPKETANAVLQHHERLDGSGYPYRLQGEQVGKVSRYLAVAEVAATLLERNGADKRIHMKLRLNRKKYDIEAVSLICELFGSGPGDAQVQRPEEVAMMTRLTQAGHLFESWVSLRKTLSLPSVTGISFLVERVESLRMMVVETGFDPCQLEDALSTAGNDDPEIVLELTVLLEELEWQFKALSREVERKQADWGAQLPVAIKTGVDGWLRQLSHFVSE